MAMRIWRFLWRALILAAMAAWLPSDAFSLSLNRPLAIGVAVNLADGKDSRPPES